MQSIERVRNTIAGKPVDHLAVQPMSMMFSFANVLAMLEVIAAQNPETRWYQGG